MKKLHIDIWSDIACPWCYVGKRRLEKALELLEQHTSGTKKKDAGRTLYDVEIVWRAFELDPSAPPESPSGVSYAERIARKYRSRVEDAQQRIDQMTELAKEDGLDFRFDRIRPGNTFDAHRVLHLALECGGPKLQDAVKERLLLAYMTEGALMSDHETLVRLASDLGLDAEAVRATLASDAYAKEVRADESEAAELGIHGVPFFVLANRYAVEGAQTADVLLKVLERAFVLEAPEQVSEGSAEVCGPDGCAIPSP